MNRFAAILLASLAHAGCTSTSSPATKARVKADLVNDRNQEGLRNMRDEFERLSADAS